MGDYEVYNYDWFQIRGITPTLHINCGITLVEVDEETCFSHMPKAI